jgi:hypothetical protein
MWSPLRGEVVDHDPLFHFDRLGRHAEGLGVQSEIENQLLGRAGDATKIRVQAHGVFIGYFDSLGPLCLLRVARSLFAINGLSVFIFGHDTFLIRCHSGQCGLTIRHFAI